LYLELTTLSHYHVVQYIRIWFKNEPSKNLISVLTFWRFSDRNCIQSAVKIKSDKK